MNQLPILYHLMRADFLQRLPNFSFLVVVGLAVYISYLYVPPSTANYATMSLGPIRGVYNSAWMGVMFGVVIVTTLPMFVFYLIKNSIERDRYTRVGQIIAATPISKPIYLLGKWLSNLAVLALIMLVMTLMAVVMQWVRGEETAVQLLPLIASIWLMGLPVMGFVAALAVLFESIPFLSGGFGNIVYFFLWMGIMISFIPTEGLFVADANDLLGLSRPFADVQQQIKAIDPAYLTGDFSIASDIYDHIELFVWEGVQWTITDFGSRLFWLLIAVLITIAAAIPFDRFDTSRRKGAGRKNGRLQRMMDRLLGKIGLGNGDMADEKMTAVPNIKLTPIQSSLNHPRFAAILSAELRLALKGQAWYWYAGVLIIIAMQLFNPIETGLQIGLAATIWPLMILSAMGNRERQNHTQKIIFSAAFPLRRQLPATWLAGVIVVAAMSAGIIFRLTMAGEWIHLLGVIAGALFIPSLALALGVWSGVNRLFEVLFLFWWYLALNQIPALDFMSAMTDAPTVTIPLVYLAGAVLLVATAVIGRRFKLQA